MTSCFSFFYHIVLLLWGKNPSSTLRSKEATPFPHSVTSLKKKRIHFGWSTDLPSHQLYCRQNKDTPLPADTGSGSCGQSWRYRFHISASLAANRRIPLRQTPPLASAPSFPSSVGRPQASQLAVSRLFSFLWDSLVPSIVSLWTRDRLPIGLLAKLLLIF